VETLNLYEALGGVAFLTMIGAQVLAVLVLKRMLAETRPDADRESRDKTPVAPPAIDRPVDAPQTFRSRYVRDFVRRTA
jgi:hypothetical protein